MVTLIELTASTLANAWVLDGYEVSSDYSDRERKWLFWVRGSDNVIRRINILIHVVDYGGAGESAEFTQPNLVAEPVDIIYTFREDVELAIPAYLTTHTKIEKWKWIDVDEADEYGKILIWENDGSDNLSEKLLFVYKNEADGITVRNLLTEYK